MWTALIRKDLRICRLPIMAGIALLVGPFVVVSMAVVAMPLWDESGRGTAWAVLLGTGAYFSIMCSQATLAMLSGNLIAAERADRSAEFLASLPPSRAQILSSKLIVLGGSAAVIWTLNLVLILVAQSISDNREAARLLVDTMAPIGRLGMLGMAAVGGGWCASAWFDSTGPSVAVAFFTPLAVFGGVSLLRYLTNWPGAPDVVAIYFQICTVIGCLLFLAGCVYYLRRVEP